jgi:ABC-type bacteriocin/lantibiotic exporter with double-glycine peptidase domain
MLQRLTRLPENSCGIAALIAFFAYRGYFDGAESLLRISHHHKGRISMRKLQVLGEGQGIQLSGYCSSPAAVARIAENRIAHCVNSHFIFIPAENENLDRVLLFDPAWGLLNPSRSDLQKQLSGNFLIESNNTLADGSAAGSL